MDSTSDTGNDASNPVERPSRLSRLSGVIWIGGAPDSGKTALGKALADRHGLTRYCSDEHDGEHLRRLARTSTQWRQYLAESLQSRWVGRSPADQAELFLQSVVDRFEMAIADLIEVSNEDVLIIAEGVRFLPGLVAPLVSDRRQAVWLLPTDEFQANSVLRRDKPVGRRHLDRPEQAQTNLLIRDRHVRGVILRQAVAAELDVWWVDGTRSTEELCDAFIRRLRQIPALARLLH